MDMGSQFRYTFAMQGSLSETVGERFQVDLLQAARDKTLAIIEATSSQIQSGMSEADVRKIIDEVQLNFGAQRNWHPPQVRFGKNTLLPFGIPGDSEVRLQRNDIFFLDLGPVFSDHEGDVGRTYAVGENKEFQRCAQDAREIWFDVRQRWFDTGATGAELYEFAAERASVRGWQLSLQEANGHRIADFPHTVRQRGSVEGWLRKPAANRWILEIQIRHPVESYGAFYEDLLN